MKKEILDAIRAPLPRKSYRTTERRPKTRYPKHIPPKEPHVTAEPNAFKVFSSILRDLRALNPNDRVRVMDAIEAELGLNGHSTKAIEGVTPGSVPVRTEPTEVITKVPLPIDDLLDVADAAKVAGVSRVALYGAISRGKVKADKSSGVVKVTRAAALAYKAHARPRKSKHRD